MSTTAAPESVKRRREVEVEGGGVAAALLALAESGEARSQQACELRVVPILSSRVALSAAERAAERKRSAAERKRRSRAKIKKEKQVARLQLSDEAGLNRWLENNVFLF